jgi:RNA recognition motif-containing protein
MSKKIYVGNMSFDTDEATLRDVFVSFGEVLSVKIIIDQFSGNSKGFAFVEMADEKCAMQAINDLNGKELGGRNLKVNEAEDKPKRDNNNRGNFNRNRY